MKQLEQVKTRGEETVLPQQPQERIPISILKNGRRLKEKRKSFDEKSILDYRM